MGSSTFRGIEIYNGIKIVYDLTLRFTNTILVQFFTDRNPEPASASQQKLSQTTDQSAVAYIAAPIGVIPEAPLPYRDFSKKWNAHQ